jgi:hypothetical protein
MRLKFIIFSNNHTDLTISSKVSLRATQVLGKPEPLLLELLMNANEPPLQPSRTIMVGDRSVRPPALSCCGVLSCT